MLDEFRQFIRSRKKANLVMVCINLAAYLVLSMFGSTENTAYMLNHGACYVPLVLEGEYYRLITAMFLHFGIYHLVYNMICLVFIGDMVETLTGSVKYLIIYLGGGLAGNLVSMAWEMHTGQYAVSAGASGGIFALIGAMICILLGNKKQVSQLYLRRFLLMAALSVAQGFTSAGTDNAAHLGGLAAGLVLCFLLYRPQRAPEKQPWEH